MQVTAYLSSRLSGSLDGVSYGNRPASLPASGQAGLRYHRQITPPKNIQAIADEN